MFERLAFQNKPLIMLHTQYRCHPKISALSNSLFYNSELIDGVTEQDRAPVHSKLPTVAFLDVSHGQEKRDRDGSFYNESEQEVIVKLIQTLLQESFLSSCGGRGRSSSSSSDSNINSDSSGENNGDSDNVPNSLTAEDIGIVVLYKSQETKIKAALSSLTLKDKKSCSLKSILVSTVDAFQGGERKIIILSCIRTSQSDYSDFIDSDRRMNVALSRAQR